MSKIRCVVFDFDGVVLESADVKTDAFVELYAHHGEDVAAKVRAHHLANLGISRFKKFAWIAENVLGTKLTDDESAQLGDRFSALALEKVLAAPFVKGAHEALLALEKSHPMYVASGTPHDELQMIVTRRQLASLFLGVHGAPAEKPAIIRGILAQHQLAPDELLFIGDGMSDYKAAVAANVAFLARDTPDLHDEWVRLGARLTPDLSALPDIVASW